MEEKVATMLGRLDEGRFFPAAIGEKMSERRAKGKKRKKGSPARERPAQP